MIRVLTILAAILALAVSAAPASAVNMSEYHITKARIGSFSIDMGSTENLHQRRKGKPKAGNGPSAMWDLTENRSE